ncbi:TetR/AcrR family transcriptional regulator [Pseudonocardia sp. WMMC193]|uniref:TetR/AcrR family transcriptional regulator n=1 Tax=Pseudonocardia sp. WMMC193 TaxID=2911965 RepID=UPI001F1C703A|nr:TetR/AcrR family transcriptional regulator [Pseudonocardia sp. WMMC193]MCF7548268.1 TetR/AcrR family transcriptional regulator [Pseudonocardia sp. WMMC193]
MTMARPGGRTARVRAAVVRAVGDALVEHGLAGVDLADVARRAGVGKTTVYRRWGTVAAAVAELVDDMVETSAPRAATGDLESDLRANAELVRSTLADPRQGRLLTALIGAARADERTAAALRRFYDARVREWEPCVAEAVSRGELPAGTDPAEVVRAVSAPLYYRLLTHGELPTEAARDRAVAAALAAARAGVYAV